jgi:hypothetical protein
MWHILLQIKFDMLQFYLAMYYIDFDILFAYTVVYDFCCDKQ